jgi:hypothetical protein
MISIPDISAPKALSASESTKFCMVAEAFLRLSQLVSHIGNSFLITVMENVFLNRLLS